MWMDSLARFQELMRELFQHDLSDLDFGIYRLLRLKRDEVEAFINEQLPRRVDEAFLDLDGADVAADERCVERLANDLRRELGPEAISPDGELSKEARGQTALSIRRMIAEYDQARMRLETAQVTEEQKVEIFNHLYAFFSRYYDEGDFIPQRFRGAHERYSIPYNGEETYFHWANRDQHYVKTGEVFKDYVFTVDVLGEPHTVRFKLTEATTALDNTKGETRFFFPQPDQVDWDEATHTLAIPFEYRLPTVSELDHYGKKTKAQDVILLEAEPRICEAVPHDILATALKQSVDIGQTEPVSLLLKRMRHFVRDNTTDYFVHKDLSRFLMQELEFYIKDQMLSLADLQGNLSVKLQMLCVFRQLAEDVIEFLAQIEDVQKRLFEKRKFVLRTDYLLPIKEVPCELWQEVLANGAQRQAWEQLFSIQPTPNLQNLTGEVNEAFLEEYPTLVVNTAYFDSSFTGKLLASFGDVDGITDGLLIKSENYQALRLLRNRYAGDVRCVYIDPPYNTNKDGFLYKDRYQHSTWLAMMSERLCEARDLLAFPGAFFCSIGDVEVARLRLLGDWVFGSDQFVANIIWKKKFSPQNDEDQLTDNHDHILLFSNQAAQWKAIRLPRSEYSSTTFSNPDHDPRGPWSDGDMTSKTKAQGHSYPVTTPSGRVVFPPPGRQWAPALDTFERLLADNRIWFGKHGGNVPRIKQFESEMLGIVPMTIWEREEVGDTQEATRELNNIVPNSGFESPKPTRLIRRICQVAVSPGSAILDFFAGSGTTGHAVIDLNREDGGQRKFCLVEMASYFDTVLLPRIQRVMFSPSWRDGKPERLPDEKELERTPRLVKVIRLESYEDALHNIALDSTLEQQHVRARAYRETVGEDTYRLRYMFKLPLDASDTMLNVTKLEHPFDYGLEILTENGPYMQTVDLVETFNYLYGLRVIRLDTWINAKDKERAYRVVKACARDNRHVLVLWRDMTNVDPAVERAFLEAKLAEEEPFDEVLINGDSATPGVHSLDGLFKRLIEEGEV
jgi:adenine-specific DNA-methyltransferase